MSVPEIANTPCACAPGQCVEGLDWDKCINNLPGIVLVQRCDRCDGHTWHQDGKCLRCKVNSTTITFG